MALSAITAYAFVLQVLLGSVVATQMVASGPAGAFALCVGESRDVDAPTGDPAGRLTHATCMVCAFASFAPPVPEAAAIVLGIASEVFFELIPPDYGRDTQRHEPRSSRGPPRIA
jgi:hypothetical protein